MCVFRRGRVFWFSFVYDGKRVQESTHQHNRKVALDLESTYRSNLAKGEAGIRKRKPALALGEFFDKQFLPWAGATFAAKPKTWKFYRNGARRLKEHASLASANLAEITGKEIGEYVAARQSAELATASINRELQVLRRALQLAVEWGVLDFTIKVKMLKGENRRERVVTPEEEALYLAAVSEPLGSIATVLVDSGMRPEECFRLSWENIVWVNGRHGTMRITHGKTSAARRMLPMTPRVRKILESEWEAAGKPQDGWVWPAPTRSGHIEPSSLRKQHAKAFKVIAEEAKKNSRKPVRPFVLYSLRHTFLTRLGQSGCDAWTLARIAGHSTIAISSRYVHPSDEGVLDAMAKFADSGVKLIQ
jgi:integrase